MKLKRLLNYVSYDVLLKVHWCSVRSEVDLAQLHPHTHPHTHTHTKAYAGMEQDDSNSLLKFLPLCSSDICGSFRAAAVTLSCRMLFPVCLFSSLFAVHDLITGTVSQSQVVLINSGMNAKFRFLLINSHSSTSITGAAETHFYIKETQLIYWYTVSSLSNLGATTQPKDKVDSFYFSDVKVKIDKGVNVSDLTPVRLFHTCGSAWCHACGASDREVWAHFLPITRDKHQGIMMVVLNRSEIPSQYKNKSSAALVTCVQHFQFFTHRFMGT